MRVAERLRQRDEREDRTEVVVTPAAAARVAAVHRRVGLGPQHLHRRGYTTVRREGGVGPQHL